MLPRPLPLATFLATVPALAAPARAEEPRGCGAFRWPVAREQPALSAPNPPEARAGDARGASTPAFRLALRPLSEAGLRKLVHYRVRAVPLLLQLSGAEAEGVQVVFECLPQAD